jgi:4a-hydroxytetrahydrobiopterin dehydratase
MTDTPAGWDNDGSTLRRAFVFKDFSEAWGFMNRVALVAEQRNHHPNWSNVWNRVMIELTTHDAGNSVTVRDLEMAAIINGLV